MDTKTVAIEIALLSLNKQKKILREIFKHISSNRKKDLFETVAYLTYPSYKWESAIQWMETRFNKKMKRTPYQVAMMYMNYAKIDRKMKPVMIKLARRAKDRVRKRKLKSNT